jgi:hypothetical protein
VNVLRRKVRSGFFRPGLGGEPGIGGEPSWGWCMPLTAPVSAWVAVDVTATRLRGWAVCL